MINQIDSTDTANYDNGSNGLWLTTANNYGDPINDDYRNWDESDYENTDWGNVDYGDWDVSIYETIDWEYVDYSAWDPATDYSNFVWG